MCREDDVREVRGLAELILPSQRDAEEGTGGFVLAGSALLGLAAYGAWTCTGLPRFVGDPGTMTR